MGKRKKNQKGTKEWEWSKKAKSRESEKADNGKEDNGSWMKEEDKDNKLFREFYQSIIPQEEFSQFISTLLVPLPTSFRITANNPFTLAVKQKVELFCKNILQDVEAHAKESNATPQAATTTTTTTTSPATTATHTAQDADQKEEDSKLEPPQPVPWYPSDLAWVFDVPRKVLRKTPSLKSFHEFLIQQNLMGGISRQEVVSMLPAFFLQAEAHHFVLDMCAAPGSKTSQLLEFIHTNKTPDNPPSGIVMANDVDEKRCYLLVHQTKRLSSPCYVITNHEAQKLPVVRKENSKEIIQFDRILCDVPCSGDGTLRKNADLWLKWNPHLGNGLHPIQFQIAMKGAKLAKIGGRLVYSTCSMNPVEDEAVVSNILRSCQGTLALVDVSKEFPSLKRRPGITSWRVMDKDGKWYANPEEVPPRRRKKITRAFFPPTEEEIKAFHLERCMRIYPHLQNTGGFFVAVFEKLGQTPFIKKNPAAAIVNPTEKQGEAEQPEDGASDDDLVAAEAVEDDEEDEDETEPNGKSKPKQSRATTTATTTTAAATTTTTIAAPTTTTTTTTEGSSATGETSNTAGAEWKKKAKMEAPFLSVSETDPAITHIREFYGVLPSFPFSQLMSRSETYQKIYFISQGVKFLLQNDRGDRLKVVNTGLRLFEKHTSKNMECEWRICQDGVLCIAPFLTKQVVHISEPDLVKLLPGVEVPLEEFSEEAQKGFEKTASGCVVFRVKTERPEFSVTPMAFVGWKGGKTCHILVNKRELAAIRPFFQ